MAKDKSFNYFKSFSRMISLSCDEAHLLKEIFVTFNPDTIEERMNEMHDIEHAGDDENHMMLDKLTTEFITPIERDDILTIAQLLDEITDAIDAVTQRMFMLNITEISQFAVPFADLIIKCCEALKDTLAEFENFKKSKTINDLIVKVNDYEDEADQLYMKANKELFTGSYDPLYVIAWMNAYSRMEACCDACEHVANTVRTAIMKNS